MGLGGGGLVTMTIQNSLLEIAAASMTSSLKTQWFDALLRQDMAYFDIKDIGGSATLISSNASRYRKGIGRKLGEGIQFAVTFLGGFAYAFWASWQTTLITLTILPLMAGTGWFLLKVNQGKTTRENKNYEEAGSVVYSTASSIKTVLSLNASRKMIVKYKNATQKAHDAAVSFWPIIGLANGSIMGAFLCSVRHRINIDPRPTYAFISVYKFNIINIIKYEFNFTLTSPFQTCLTFFLSSTCF